MRAASFKAATVLAVLTLIGAPALVRASPPDAVVAPPSMARPAARPARGAAAWPLKVTAAERAEAGRMDPLAQVAFWDKVTEADPGDIDARVKLAQALRALGRNDEADAEVSQALVVEPKNLEALLEQARDRIAAGRGFFAIAPAEKAERLAPRDWRCPSLLAIALEQDNRDDEALAAHRRALALAPDNPAPMTNLAMFEATHGQAREAEALLAAAAARPDASAQVRQDYALVLGLDGRLAEAVALERRDLPPEAVANDLAYLRAAQSQLSGHSWAAVAQ